MELIAGHPIEIDGVKIELEGGVTHGSVSRGSALGTTSRSASGLETAADVLHSAIARSDLRLAATLELAVEATDVSRTRGLQDAGEPRIVLEPPELAEGETCHVALVEEDGTLHWEFAQPGSRRFELEVDSDAPTERGLAGRLVRKAVRFLAVKGLKVIGKPIVGSLVGLAEKRLRPTRLRTFTEKNYYLKDDEAPDLTKLTQGPALLLIHGTASRTDEAFGRFERQWVADLNHRYDGRVFAFDHPSLSVSPTKNAERLVELLSDESKTDSLELDVLSHSRGGLVARELAQRLRPERIRIRSLIFVATPNSGTPLADAAHLGEFVNGLTNLVSWLPAFSISDAIEVVLELVKDIALDVAYDALEGVRCMAPDSEYLQTLNHLPLPEDTPFRAMAANFEPLSTDKLLFKLANRVLDRVFEGVMNDLIVPTRSAFLRSGDFHVPADQRIAFDSSFGIYHSGFWTQPKVASRLDDWLRPDWPEVQPAPAPPETADINADVESLLAKADSDGLQAAFNSLIQLPKKFEETVAVIAGGPVSEPPPGDDPLGTVVVLPGIMGSLLDVEGTRTWVSTLKLHRGGFARLALGHGEREVNAVGLNPVYAQLVTRLARRWQVFLFPYDWRGDIFESAKQLAQFIRETVWADGQRPVHFVAHSMGGLVVRALAADPDDRLWDEIDDPDDHQKGGRLLMLGTPNRGSYAIPLAFLGEELLVKGLALLDRQHDKTEIAEIIATFPGTYQMLPAPHLTIDDDHEQLFSASAWGSLPISSDLLARAKDFHDRLQPVHNPERIVYVAGDGHRTPARLRIDQGKLHFGTHDGGDGRVLHASGRLEGVDRFYYCTSSHGDLVKDSKVLDELDNLLKLGKSAELATAPFARRGTETDEDRSTPLAANQVDADMTGLSRGGRSGGGGSKELDEIINEATQHYFGAGPQGKQRRPMLRVRVTHASLEQAAHPVAVGHYRGIPPEGAEGFLDGRLDNLLRQHRALDDYPEIDGEVLFIDAPGQQPPGGIVLGLGEFGGLTRSKLVRQVARAAVRRTMRAVEVGRLEGSLQSIGLSAVLIGTPGRYGLAVESSVAALVEGVVRAIIDLSEKDVWERVRLEELQIIELYEVRATHATEVAQQTRDNLPAKFRDRIDLRLPEALETGRGCRPGMPSRNDSGDPWPRIIVEKKRRKGRATYPRLRFTSLGRSAQVDRLTVPYNDRKIAALIRESVRRPDAVDEAVSLYELLFPHDAKLELDETDNLHLLVDENTAAIPWEILAGRSDRGRDDALALRTGMLRQLRATRTDAHKRSKSVDPVGFHALVVGDPPVGTLPRLPGARREALEVANQLKNSNYQVDSLVYSDHDSGNYWRQIQIALSRHPYRILHFATHGEVDAKPARQRDKPECSCDPSKNRPGTTGLVIGDGVHLTALDFQQMSVTPDFVFLNACHVGRTSTSPGAERLSDQRVNELAANVALQLMKNGVKAVVAAGWAIDDRAALVFAQTLYENLLGGEPFGEAVQTARRAAYQADAGRSNTWGAYQCYGDPSFTLSNNRPKSRSQPGPASIGEMIRRLEVLEQKAGDATTVEWLTGLFDGVKTLDENHLHRFSKPPVYHVLAKAYAELGAYEDAVWAYRRVKQHALKGKLPLVAVEQLANMEVRLACQIELKERSPRWPAVHPCKDDPKKLFEKAKRRLDKLIRLEPTGERHALLGSYWKKRATTLRPSSRRASLKKAENCYYQAWKLSSKDQAKYNPYHTTLWVQMAALALPETAKLPKAVRDALDKLDKQTQEARKERPQPVGSTDFWAETAIADVAISRAVVLGEEFTAAEDGYRRAFYNRSTVREHDSVLDHLRDLEVLFPKRKAEIQELIQKLTT